MKFTMNRPLKIVYLKVSSGNFLVKFRNELRRMNFSLPPLSFYHAICRSVQGLQIEQFQRWNCRLVLQNAGEWFALKVEKSNQPVRFVNHGCFKSNEPIKTGVSPEVFLERFYFPNLFVEGGRFDCFSGLYVWRLAWSVKLVEAIDHSKFEFQSLNFERITWRRMLNLLLCGF